MLVDSGEGSHAAHGVARHHGSRVERQRLDDVPAVQREDVLAPRITPAPRTKRKVRRRDPELFRRGARHDA